MTAGLAVGGRAFRVSAIALGVVANIVACTPAGRSREGAGGPDCPPEALTLAVPLLGRVIRLFRLGGQLFALINGAMVPVDEEGAPVGPAVPVDCSLTFYYSVPTSTVASSSTRLACLSAPRGCGGEHGLPDCHV